MATADEQRREQMVDDHESRLKAMERRMDEAFPAKNDDAKKPAAKT